MTQGFVAHLLEHAGLGKAEQAKGRFRTFLLASLRHFLANERERARAQKRGGGRPLVSLDTVSAETRLGTEAATRDRPDQAYDRNWALALMEQAMRRLTAEQEAAGKGAQFGRLRECLMGEPTAPGYAVLAKQMGAGVEAVRMAVWRLRRRYGQLLREEIAQTVSSPAEVEDELRHLCGVWTVG